MTALASGRVPACTSNSGSSSSDAREDAQHVVPRRMRCWDAGGMRSSWHSYIAPKACFPDMPLPE